MSLNHQLQQCNSKLFEWKQASDKNPVSMTITKCWLQIYDQIPFSQFQFAKV